MTWSKPGSILRTTPDSLAADIADARAAAEEARGLRPSRTRPRPAAAPKRSGGMEGVRYRIVPSGSVCECYRWRGQWYALPEYPCPVHPDR